MPLHSVLTLDSPEQLRALANETRARILRVLEERTASAKDLAELLGETHGKVGHHMRVLREAGLIHVVEERKVRAVTEKFYGLTFQRLRVDAPPGDRLVFVLDQAAREASYDQPFDQPAGLVTTRLSSEKASEFHRRVFELIDEFDRSASPTGTVYGLLVAVFSTDTPE